MNAPSGDHVGLATPLAWRVTTCASPPPAGITAICPSRMKRIRVESGDQRGEASPLSPLVSWTGAPPAISWRQM